MREIKNYPVIDWRFVEKDNKKYADFFDYLFKDSDFIEDILKTRQKFVYRTYPLLGVSDPATEFRKKENKKQFSNLKILVLAPAKELTLPQRRKRKAFQSAVSTLLKNHFLPERFREVMTGWVLVSKDTKRGKIEKGVQKAKQNGEDEKGPFLISPHLAKSTIRFSERDAGPRILLEIYGDTKIKDMKIAVDTVKQLQRQGSLPQLSGEFLFRNRRFYRNRACYEGKTVMGEDGMSVVYNDKNVYRHRHKRRYVKQ